MTKRFGALAYVFAFAILAVFAHDAVGATRQQHAFTGKHADHATPPRHKQASEKSKGSNRAHRTTEKGGNPQARDIGRTGLAQIPIPLPRPAPPPAGNLGTLKQAIELVRKGKTGEATTLKNMLDDEGGQTLIEWFVLRHPNGEASFRRYAAFIDENPNWPSMRQLRHRAEGRLWQEKSDAVTVHRFTADQPVSGRIELRLQFGVGGIPLRLQLSDFCSSLLSGVLSPRFRFVRAGCAKRRLRGRELCLGPRFEIDQLAHR
jgi:soluble lytic murein transglycosylase